MTSWKNWGIGFIVGVFLIFGAYLAGRHHKDPTIKWYSDMTSQLQGQKIYLIDTPVVCPNHNIRGPNGAIQLAAGKPVGRIQLDVNLQTGELRVVTNTVPAVFECEK